MTTLLKKRRRITPEQFLRNASKLRGYELVDGMLERMTPTGGESTYVADKWCRVIGGFVEDHDLGYCFTAECIYACFPKRPEMFRKPDYSFIRKDRMTGPVPKGVVNILPDLILEVVSPDDRWSKLERKIDEYLEAGTPLVWVLNPELRSVQVYRPGQPVLRLFEHDTLDGGEILPGFNPVISTLFPRNWPAPV